MKRKILLSGVGGSAFPYLFYLENNYELYFVDSNESIKKIYPDKKIFQAPQISKEPAKYKELISTLIESHKIDFYFPLIDEELILAHDICEHTNCKVIAPGREFISLCLNKYLLSQKLSELNISHLKTLSHEEFEKEPFFPLFVKPICGRGSRGAKRIENRAELEAFFVLEKYKREEMLYQELLIGTEYSISCCVNSLNIPFGVVPKKIISKKGITIQATTQKHQKIEAQALDIVNRLNPCGTFNIQLTEVDGELKIFEINPRFSTTSILTVEAGVDEFGLCVELYDEKSVAYLKDFKEDLHIYRRWESIFYV